MYLVKVDLSVHGVPYSVTRGYQRHIELHVESDTPLGAIKKAMNPAPLVDMVLCVGHYAADNSDVLSRTPVVSVRYSVFDYTVRGNRLDKISKVATCVRDFTFDAEND